MRQQARADWSHRVRGSRLLLCILLTALGVSTFAAGQQPDPQRSKRPIIGVALSGGGALGLAHIGVIQYFEEHHIPIDRIAGTSMGGLVGGFYAAGMESRELKGIVEQADWDTLLSPNPQFREQPVVEKQEWNRSSGTFALRFGKRFSLPSGLNPGEALALMLSRNTAGYPELSSFDSLPTPFRCVATDLVSGDAFVLSSGSLPKAMRATMALPAVFTPVKWGGKVLVDGGLVENVPVEVVREMGAEIKIAVTLETPNANAAQFNSLLSVLRQAVSVAIIQNERRSISQADLVITVNTQKYSGTDYTKAQDLIRAGYEAAQAKAQDLARFEVSPEEWEIYSRSRQRRTRPTPKEGRVVEVAAPRPFFQKDAQAELERKLGTGNVDVSELDDVLSGIVTATSVPGASYQWSRTKQGVEGYRVEFLDRPGQSNYIRPSFHFSLSSGEPSQSTLNLALSTVPANTYKSRALGSVSIGYDPGFRTEFYHPFNGSGYFIAPGLLIQRFNVNEYVGATRTRFVRDRFAATFYGGIGTWRFAQLRIGVQTGYDSYSQPITVNGVPANSHGFVNPEAVWIYNTQDAGGLPNRGTRIDGSIGYSFRNTSFPYLRSNFSTFHPLTTKFSVFALGNADSSFGRNLNFYDQYPVGGQMLLSAYRYQEFHANTAVVGGGGLIIRSTPVRSFSFYPGIAIWYEVGRLDLGAPGWQTHQSTSSGIFFPTPLGAAGLAVSFNEAGKARFRLSLGSIQP
jgi:NTE family protein